MKKQRVSMSSSILFIVGLIRLAEDEPARQSATKKQAAGR
jgi:hypothetical protein